MEAILFVGGLLLIVICVGPALMALIALIQIQSLKNEVASLSEELYALRSGQRDGAPQLMSRQAPTPASMSLGRSPQPSPQPTPQLAPEPPPSGAPRPDQALATTSTDQASALDAVTAPLHALTPESPQAQTPESAPAMSDALTPQTNEAAQTPEAVSSPRPEPTPQATQARGPEHAPPPADAARPSAKPIAPDETLDSPDEDDSPELFRLFNELDWGGKLTGFIGIGLLLIGVAFMVGYAVNQGWIGPLGRVAMGAGFGVFLLGLAERLERRQRRLIKPLVRILSGGGMAVLYLCIFAAFGLYKLIPELATAVLLFACALLTFGLARRYRSEVMAFVGLIGAFLTPLALLSGDVSLPFVLSYIALINLPLLGFAISQSWHVLYNVAGLLTGFLLLILAAEQPEADRMFILGFGIVSSVQFILLGLLRMRSERSENMERFDQLRLTSICAGVLFFFHPLLYKQPDVLSATLFGFMAISAIGFAVALRLRQQKIEGEAAIFFVSMMLSLSLALRALLDGSVLTLAWSIQGLALCALGLKLRVPIAQLLGLLLGMSAMFKGLTLDVVSSAQTPWQPLRFGVNLWAVAALALQGELTRRMAAEDAPTWQARALTSFAILGLGVVLSLELMIKPEDLTHLLLSLLWGLEGVIFCMLALSWRSENVRALGFLLGGAIALKTLTFDASLREGELFLNTRFICSMAVLGLFFGQALLTHGTAKHRQDKSLLGSGQWLYLWSQLGLIALVTIELFAAPERWGLPLVTVWWGINAFVLVGVGLFKDVRLGRRAGMFLIGVTTLKLLFFDTSELEGIARILSFMGVGVMLLLLSYLYQRTQGMRAPERDLPQDD